jgi:hypothetical protein
MAPTNNTYPNWTNPEFMENIWNFMNDYPWSFDYADLLGVGSLTDEEMRLFDEQLDRMRALFQWEKHNAQEEYLEEYYDQCYHDDSQYLSTVGFHPDEWQPRRWYSNPNPGRKDRNTKLHKTTYKTPTKAKLSVKRNLKKRDVKDRRSKIKKDTIMDQEEYFD